MSEVAIPVDLYNPGQVFACLGFMEAAEILLGDAEGGFDWRNGEDIRFVLRAAGDPDPFLTVLRFLHSAKVEAIAPAESDLRAKEPGIETVTEAEGIYSCPKPDSPSALPCRLTDVSGNSVSISHWIAGTGLDNIKFWAGMAGYSGSALVRDLLQPVKGWSENQLQAVAADPFGNRDLDAASHLQSSNLRFDYRGGTIPFDAGFSTNAHGQYMMLGFPLVDVLAAIGLENARPARPERGNKLAYVYNVWPVALPPILARAALGGAVVGFTPQTYRIELGWPGQENQARAIKTVKKETHS